jgi:hypothetical protein
MGIKVIDRLVLVVYGTAGPTDAQWIEHLGLVECNGIDRTAHLIVTDGGGPTAAQRRLLYGLLAGRTRPVAVVSGSLRVRAIVTAISWFNGAIKAFPASGLPEAIAHLEIPGSRWGLITSEVAMLARRLGRASEDVPP